MKCQTGECEREAIYQTYFMGGPFMKLCAECEEEVFPKSIFPMKDDRELREKTLAQWAEEKEQLDKI